jgi:oxygen-independent coproporphyrinogen-3 oxidase
MVKAMSLGIYISIPFCRSKCSYCNFASGVFSKDRMAHFKERVCTDILTAPILAKSLHATLDRHVDTIYLGGGTPSILPPEMFQEIISTLHNEFDIAEELEFTVECAPGTITDAMLDAFLQSGVNRISLGVQSFVDQEARAVARMHDRETTFRDVERLRAHGVTNINLDLIAGLPHQTMESWHYSVSELIALATPHASVYMLEIDEDSRLGRELIAGGTKYHAHHVPDNDLIADMYEFACVEFNSAGIHQYEISNFAISGKSSLHNLKYWQRQPYLGFGLDAHSFLPVQNNDVTEAVRFSTTDDLESFLKEPSHSIDFVNSVQANEEKLFLGLRLNQGIPIQLDSPSSTTNTTLHELLNQGLLLEENNKVFLSPRGRLISNDVFAKFIDA